MCELSNDTINLRNLCNSCTKAHYSIIYKVGPLFIPSVLSSASNLLFLESADYESCLGVHLKMGLINSYLISNMDKKQTSPVNIEQIFY